LGKPEEEKKKQRAASLSGREERGGVRFIIIIYPKEEEIFTHRVKDRKGRGGLNPFPSSFGVGNSFFNPFIGKGKRRKKEASFLQSAPSHQGVGNGQVNLLKEKTLFFLQEGNTTNFIEKIERGSAHPSKSQSPPGHRSGQSFVVDAVKTTSRLGSRKKKGNRWRGFPPVIRKHRKKRGGGKSG